MPPRLKHNEPLYIFDENDNSFRSIGCIHDCNLHTDLAEMMDLDTISTGCIYDLSEVKVELKLSLWSRFKLWKIVKMHKNE